MQRICSQLGGLAPTPILVRPRLRSTPACLSCRDILSSYSRPSCRCIRVGGAGATGKETQNVRTKKNKEEDEKAELNEDEELPEEEEEDHEPHARKRGSYLDMAGFLEEAFNNDREAREILEDSVSDPEKMRKRVEERVRRKKLDMLQPKTGSASPMKVSFKDFDASDTYIWMELYNDPVEKDIDILGNVIRSWYLMGCLGGYNSVNMQLTRIPVNERLTYNENVEDDILPARFHNIGELEFQHNWGRFWIDMGTSDPLALDVLINMLSAFSSDYVGVKELTFGGKDLGTWNKDMTVGDEGYKSFRI